uniref:Uncharacterized protein n=1 Tax=Parascaris univalens TaxID=6257 RepID=A0A915AL09_PARUN
MHNKHKSHVGRSLLNDEKKPTILVQLLLLQVSQRHHLAALNNTKYIPSLHLRHESHGFESFIEVLTDRKKNATNASNIRSFTLSATFASNSGGEILFFLSPFRWRSEEFSGALSPTFIEIK